MFDQAIIGQGRIAAYLARLVACGRMPHAVLFHGPDGVGKTAAAIELAKTLHCERPASGSCGACKSCCRIQTLNHPDFGILFPFRSSVAGAAAREIHLLRPEVVGLQEVYDLQVDIEGLPKINLPFLDILLGKLASRGLNYQVAAKVMDTDAQLPGINLVDYDVILVNPNRVEVLDSDGQRFTNNLGDPFGIGIDIFFMLFRFISHS